MRKIKLIFLLLVSLGVSTAAYGNDFNGTFVCDVKMNGDGSGNDQVIKISGNILKHKYMGDDDSYFTNYTAIHTGAVNPFKTFVQTGNFVHEDILVIRATDKKNVFHFNNINTASGWKVKSRLSYGVCQKI